MIGRRQPLQQLELSNGWVIDKRISLPTLLTLLVYLVAMVWTASKFDSRLTTVENVTSDNTKKIEQIGADYTSIMVRLATIDERQASIQVALGRIEKKLDR